MSAATLDKAVMAEITDRWRKDTGASGQPDATALLTWMAPKLRSAEHALTEIAAKANLFRNITHAKPAPSTHSSSVKPYRFSGWVLDPARRELINPSGEIENITTAEFDVLERLARAPNTVVTRAAIASEGCGRIWAGKDDRSIDAVMVRLRKRLKDDPDNPRLIKTVYGRGYLMAGDASLCVRRRSRKAVKDGWMLVLDGELFP